MTHRPVDRRAFLAASAATAASAAGLLAGHAPAPLDDLGFTLGVQTYTFRNFDLEPALKRIKELGLKHAEFYSKHIPAESSPEQIKEILKLCKEYDVTPVGFGVSAF